MGSHRNDKKRRAMFESSRKKTGGHRCPVAASVAQLETGGKKSGHEKGWVKQDTELRDRVRYWNEDMRR